MKKKLLQYGICGAIGALLAYWVMHSEGLFEVWSERTAAVAILCDAFFVPGILFIMVGALVWIASTGFFDSIGYAARTASHLLLPSSLRKGERKSYYEYKTEKAEKRGKFPIYIFIVGAFFLFIWLICVIIGLI